MNGEEYVKEIAQLIAKLIIMWFSYIAGYGLIWYFAGFWVSLGVFLVQLASVVERGLKK